MKGVFLIFSFSVLVTLTQVNASMAPSNPPIIDDKYEYITYLLDSSIPAGVKPEDYYIKLLIPVLGSEKAAKDAIVHSLRVIKAFVAWLTPNQASTLQKQSGDILVVKSRTFPYHPEPWRK